MGNETLDNKTIELEVKVQQKQVASYVSKVLRDHFGKGPESVYVSLSASHIIMHMRNFLSPIEKVVMEQEGIEAVEALRDILMKQVLPEIKGFLATIIELDHFDFYFDWNIQDKSGMITGIHRNEVAIDNTEQHASFEKMIEKVAEITKIAEKQPAYVFLEQVNPRMIVVVRKGLLNRIEKELIGLGHEQILQIAKRRLEKALLKEGEFDKILGVAIKDIFVDWNFQLDRSVIVFITDPKIV